VNATELLSELYYRNKENIAHGDTELNMIAPTNGVIHMNKPIFKNKLGKRLTLPTNLQINPDKIVRYLNIKAKVMIEPSGDIRNAADAYYD
jgi:hypothetical protein